MRNCNEKELGVAGCVVSFVVSEIYGETEISVGVLENY